MIRAESYSSSKGRRRDREEGRDVLTRIATRYKQTEAMIL